MWTFVSNFSKLVKVRASSSEQAIDFAIFYNSKEFFEKANVFVFDKAPVFIAHGEKAAEACIDYTETRAAG
jgi:hypothetical protein